MRYSQTLIPTVKEVPAEAEIPSHQLMIRAGFIRKVASGTYTYLPLGNRSLLKIIAIVREEMNRAGAQEILMPVLQPMELWEATGRREDYGETLAWFEDRHGRENVLAPTAEEVVTSLVAAEINSYRQLPVNLYQINTKVRDEFRPRFGVLRSREFIMKDAYSFHANVDDLEKTYRAMYDAYCRIFSRCGLKYVAVEADSGPIGGSASHEFMVPCSAGEDVIVHAEDFSYAANLEKAEIDAPAASPQLAAARQAAPAMEEVHTPGVGSIEAVCNFLKNRPADMIKTLVYTSGKDVIVALLRGDHEANENKLRRACDGAALEMAPPEVIKNVTSAAVGFAGPQGLAGKITRLIVDNSVAAMTSGVTGANKTDYHVRNVVPGRDFPLSGANVVVADIRNAVDGDTRGGKALKFSRGIEVGHVFKLGTKYSQKLSANFLDEQGQKQPCIMGCYGIGINRILASAIEMGHDDNGCVLPIAIAPFEVLVVPINISNPEVMGAAERIYKDLQAGGADVLLDDRDARPGVKFKDADLLGIPLRIVVGEKSLKEGKVELKARTEAKPTLVDLGAAVARTLDLAAQLKSQLSGESR
ncbi:MAG: proline--tRNA ligase [Planctomycetes bacterium]|nr:proline--tRNA ligase [Planctomycetota bacterium]